MRRNLGLSDPARVVTLIAACVALWVISVLGNLAHGWLGPAPLAFMVLGVATIGWMRGPMAGVLAAISAAPCAHLAVELIEIGRSVFVSGGFGPGFFALVLLGVGAGQARRSLVKTQIVEARASFASATLKLIVADRTLTDVMDALALRLEKDVPCARCSVRLVDPGQLEFDLPDPLPIGSDQTAAGQVPSDCWSIPFRTAAGELLGVFTIHHDKPRVPEPYALDVLEEATQIAELAVERDRLRRQREELEEQVRQSQKLDGLGLLAGGIAHDFNNLLVPVLGNAELLSMELEDRDHLGYLEDIRQGASRCAELADQMLTYAGRRMVKKQAIELSSLTSTFIGWVASSLPKRIKLEMDLDPDLPSIEAARPQVEQVLLNLVTNAADAIGDQPGKISIRTASAELPKSHFARMLHGEEMSGGRYVTLQVEDDGEGLDPAARERIFDPFFSTRAQGRGLGLATTFGIVRTHRGAIEVDSELGRGARFAIYFPSIEQPVPQPRSLAPLPRLEGGGLALVVDDEESVRRVASKYLEHLGYKVMRASSGPEGLGLFREHADDIRLFLLDVSMPEMDGPQVLRELGDLVAETQVVFMTGFDSDRVDLSQGASLLRKPYDLAALQRVLAQNAGQNPER